MARGKPNVWGCEHHYPIVVAPTGSGEGQQRARCLGCGARGPESDDAERAMEALRAEARYGRELGA